MHSNLEEIIRILKRSKKNTINLPYSSLDKLARNLLFEKNFHDQKWVDLKIIEEEKIIKSRRGIAKIKGFEPFTNMGYNAYNEILSKYDPWILSMMKKRLSCREDICGDWAVQFASTMNCLGREKCEKSKNLYSFVTTSSEWNNTKKDRKNFILKNRLRKRKKIITNLDQKSNNLNNYYSDLDDDYDIINCESISPQITIKIIKLENSIENLSNDQKVIVKNNNRTFEFVLSPYNLKKIAEGIQKFQKWIAIIVGDLGVVSNETIHLENPKVQIFERK